MQRLKFLGVVLAGAMAASGAHAGSSEPPFRAEARLVKAVSVPVEKKVAGVTWRCEGDTCVGTAAHRPLASWMKECRLAAVALGPVAHYASRGRTFSPRGLDTCNGLAARDLSRAGVLTAAAP